MQYSKITFFFCDSKIEILVFNGTELHLGYAARRCGGLRNNLEDVGSKSRHTGVFVFCLRQENGRGGRDRTRVLEFSSTTARAGVFVFRNYVPAAEYAL